MDRAVFQRNNTNHATIHIGGNYTRRIDRVDAKVTKIGDGGNSTDWQTIQSNVQGGFYSGSIEIIGGWYRLEVRGMLGDQVVGTSSVEHVGAGEVFIISGQSNGQGFLNRGSPDAADDRVSCVNYNNTNDMQASGLPYPHFSHLNSSSSISPRGESAWAWGRLGDLLASKLDVPILFYNTAFEGTRVKSWREGITGTSFSPYVPLPYSPSGMPYINLRWVMQYYVPITGVRAVLWEQGEAENLFPATTDEYASDLKAVIDASRNESGKNVSWMVALTSYDNAHGTNNNTIEGQKKVINNVANVFAGPNTDLIQIPRQEGSGNGEGVHFNGPGITELASAWNNQLNDSFFSQSQPQTGQGPLRPSISCSGNNSVNISVDAVGYNSISWSGGQNGNTIQVGNGSYRAVARDDKGNFIYSPEIRISEPIQPGKPSITLEGSNPVCIGNTAVLIASTNENVTWNNGFAGQRLGVTTGGEYTVTTKNIYGCEATSDKYAISVLNAPLPPKPTITAGGAVTFCDGGSVNLQSSSAVKSVWSNGETTATIAAKVSGDYRVRALDNLGCFSPDSDPLTVKVNPLPARPQISLSGPTEFCDGGTLNMTSNYDTGNIWSTTATSKTIPVKVSGTFSLTQRDGNGCESRSDEVVVKVNPLPATPSVTALRPTTFCERDYTTLRSSEAYSYVWSNGSGNREIDIRESGDFTISAKDEKGCISIASAVTKVVKNPLPPQPAITAVGPTTFCADLSVKLESTTAVGYLWSNGESSQSVTITTAGSYTVQTINEFQCYSDPSNQISTQTLALPPAPKTTALGLTTFCDGDTVQLQASEGQTFFWTSGQEAEIIDVTTSGSYAARIVDDKGCYSPYSTAILVDVKPTPSTPTIRKTGTYTLISENNINDGDHVWLRDGTVLSEKSTTIKVVQSGTYTVNNTVVYSPTLSCYSDFSAPFIFSADMTTGGMVVYPNPVSTGIITVETIQNISNARVEVMDSRGVIHKSFLVNKFDGQKIFNISDLSTGIYIIRIISSDYSGAQKIVLSH
ncbi:hypothetical protein DYBT9275_05186 [Dyadobacter sp. CECT 9275]|uniref:T9SS type A sorting domain-containing protein n=1 Tax=Dyadobacter helix TaxID=2822344 RepID=A0A916JFU0_9BACT|nr:T9SS type A sorting domain-containing protein [Dyadobacter sp. CECT 9275]CAG5012487.1 hypothetical protein DYBT9275_05186 [Dyadobacter sp. CECT 9275]